MSTTAGWSRLDDRFEMIFMEEMRSDHIYLPFTDAAHGPASGPSRPASGLSDTQDRQRAAIHS
jgi:hypothetical protein